MTPAAGPPMVEMPEGYYKGRVKILILFFEELAKTGKILEFSNFYDRWNGIYIPMKELQTFMNDLPTKKTDEEKKEIADQLFNRHDSSVKQLLKSFLEKNTNPISVTKFDDKGNVIQVYNRKDSVPFLNGAPLQINGDSTNLDQQDEEEEEVHENHESSSDLEWLKQNDKFINVFEKEEVLTKEPIKQESFINEEDIKNFFEKSKNKNQVQNSEEKNQEVQQEDQQLVHDVENHVSSENNEIIESQSEEIHEEKTTETESVTKELSEKDKENAEIHAAEMRMYAGLFSGKPIVEDWNFEKNAESTENGQTSTETHNNDYQSLFQSFNEIISGMDERHQKENQEAEERLREELLQQDALEEERLKQIEHQRQLYEQQQREIEERIRDIEAQKLKDEENRKEHEKIQQEMVLEQQNTSINHEQIEAIVKVEESNQTSADNVHSNEQQVNEQTDSANIQNNDVAIEVHENDSQARTIPKTLEIEQTTRPANENQTSPELSASINSLVMLYIKFIAALHKILKAGPEKIERFDEFKQIHDLYQTLVDRLIYIDENQEPDSEEYNRDILEAIRQFYTGEEFLKILKQLKSDDSEFCKVLDYLLTKTNSKSQQISDEFNNTEAKNLATITQERLESVKQLGQENQNKVKELLGNNSDKLQSNYEKVITTLNVVIKHFSKYDYLAASSMHLERYEKLQVKQPGKLCLFRDKMLLIIEKKPTSETVFSSSLKDVKVQQVVKNPSAPKKFFGRIIPCHDKSLISDDDVEKNASKNLLQVTQRTEKYRNTFRLQIISGERGRTPDAKEFANMFDKLARLPDFQSVLAELEEFEKQT